jgi:hypothetical protein
MAYSARSITALVAGIALVASLATAVRAQSTQYPKPTELPNPYRPFESWPTLPVSMNGGSATVGMSGSVSERVAVVTASARSLSALMYSIDPGIEANISCTCAPSKSVSAGAQCLDIVREAY